MNPCMARHFLRNCKAKEWLEAQKNATDVTKEPNAC